LLLAVLFLLQAAVSQGAQNREPKTILIWPDGAPGALGNEDLDQPTLTLYPAESEINTGSAVVICPGGGYAMVAMDHEGHQIARWFNSIGVSAFVLRYRLGMRYHHPAPLQDVQQAIRYVRVSADDWGVDPDRIGVMGFSAGGHLASSAGTHFGDGDPAAPEPIARISCRPDFMILVYPVISFTTSYTHQGSKRHLLGEDPDPALVESLSNELQVTAATPPTFLIHADDDRGVPPENSILFYLALKKAGVPAELHVYRNGGHGFGLASQDAMLNSWSGQLRNWLLGMGLLRR
jgi:acetyl esterase/lipase